jgi:hypothetical protein
MCTSPNRLLKKAHLLGPSLWLGTPRAGYPSQMGDGALHLDLLEQPGDRAFHLTEAYARGTYKRHSITATDRAATLSVPRPNGAFA